MTASTAVADPRIVEAAHDALSQKQINSIAWSLGNNAFGLKPKVCMWDGAVRSGKTIASLLAWCQFVVTAPRGGELVVVGRTRESIGRNVFGPLTDPEIMGELAHFINYTSGAPTATMFGRKVHVLGASDVRSEMVLRGLTVAGAYVDEATLVAEPFWVQLLARLSVKGAQCFATTNPDGPAHYLNKTVISRIEELGYKRFHFKLTDNEFLMKANPEYVEQLMKEYSGLWKLRFIEGLWVQAEGAIYDIWDAPAMTVKPEQIPTIERVYMIGLDFGTNHPTRAYALGLGRHWESDRWVLYTLAEFAPPVGLTIGKQSRLFQDFIASVERRWKKADWISVDPAAAHFRVQLMEDGITNVMRAHNAVVAGILTNAALLATGQMYISTECEHLIDMLPGYMWDAKATARGETAPVKDKDDEVDAWRYTVYSARRFWRDKISVTPARDDAPEASDEE